MANDLTLGEISSINLAFGAAKVAATTYIDVSFVLDTPVGASDFILLSFGAEFLLEDASGGTVSCNKIESGASTGSLTCAATFASGVLQSVKIEGLCACDGTTTYTVRVNNVMNILEAKAFTNVLTVNSKVSDTVLIGTGTLNLDTISTLTANELLETTVVRSATAQGATASFTLSFKTPGELLDAATIKISIPKNQAVRTAAYICTNTEDNSVLSCAETVTASSEKWDTVDLVEWKCISGNCAKDTVFTLQLSNTQNPLIAATAEDDFKIEINTAGGNAIFVSPSPLTATPALEVGPINDHTITHQNTRYTN